MSVLRYSELFGKNNDLVSIDVEKLISFCIEEAHKSKRKRMLMLLHEGDFETAHRFINVLLPGTQLSIHRHMSKYQTEFYIPLKGKAATVCFDAKGKVKKHFALEGGDGDLQIIEIKPKTWHTIIPLTPFVMFELKGQPEHYDPKNDKEFAPWAPKEGENGFDEYINNLLNKLNIKTK